MNKTPFSYTILRYIHNVATGEFLNVGVVVYAPKEKIVQSKIQHKFGRLSDTFNNFNGNYYRKVARHIENNFNSLDKVLFSTLQYEDAPLNAYDITKSVLPQDDSCLQFNDCYYGITEDVKKSLNELYDYFVLGSCPHDNEARRSNDDVWNYFQPSLTRYGVIQKLEPVVITGGSFEYEFKHAWKNSKWHPLEAVSMDAEKPDTLRDRAIKWVGRTTDLQSDPRLGMLYLLVGKPQMESHMQAYHKSVDFLHKMPIEHEIIKEDEAEDFAVAMSSRISMHEKQEV